MNKEYWTWPYKTDRLDRFRRLKAPERSLTWLLFQSRHVNSSFNPTLIAGRSPHRDLSGGRVQIGLSCAFVSVWNLRGLKVAGSAALHLLRSSLILYEDWFCPAALWRKHWLRSVWTRLRLYFHLAAAPRGHINKDDTKRKERKAGEGSEKRGMAGRPFRRSSWTSTLTHTIGLTLWATSPSLIRGGLRHYEHHQSLRVFLKAPDTTHCVQMKTSASTLTADSETATLFSLKLQACFCFYTFKQRPLFALWLPRSQWIHPWFTMWPLIPKLSPSSLLLKQLKKRQIDFFFFFIRNRSSWYCGFLHPLIEVDYSHYFIHNLRLKPAN